MRRVKCKKTMCSALPRPARCQVRYRDSGICNAGDTIYSVRMELKLFKKSYSSFEQKLFLVCHQPILHSSTNFVSAEVRRELCQWHTRNMFFSKGAVVIQE